jgi:hypothetical protein
MIDDGNATQIPSSRKKAVLLWNRPKPESWGMERIQAAPRNLPARKRRETLLARLLFMI